MPVGLSAFISSLFTAMPDSDDDKIAAINAVPQSIGTCAKGQEELSTSIAHWSARFRMLLQHLCTIQNTTCGPSGRNGVFRFQETL